MSELTDPQLQQLTYAPLPPAQPAPRLAGWISMLFGTGTLLSSALGLWSNIKDENLKFLLGFNGDRGKLVTMILETLLVAASAGIAVGGLRFVQSRSTNPILLVSCGFYIIFLAFDMMLSLYRFFDEPLFEDLLVITFILKSLGWYFATISFPLLIVLLFIPHWRRATQHG